MKKTVKAKVVWTSPEEGGRKLISPEFKYTIPSYFEDEAGKRPKGVWSLVVEPAEAPNESMETMARVWFLFGNEPLAPNHLLHPGSRFELRDGVTTVAKGEVLDEGA